MFSNGRKAVAQVAHAAFQECLGGATEFTISTLKIDRYHPLVMQGFSNFLGFIEVMTSPTWRMTPMALSRHVHGHEWKGVPQPQVLRIYMLLPHLQVMG